jgi:4'-phosphopantetheinyl transferase
VSQDEVRLWSVRLDLEEARVASLRRLLDQEELGRVDSLRFPAHRRRFVVAHAAMRLIVGAHLATPPARVRWSRDRYGKPQVEGAQVNLSHSGDLALLAISDHRPVGVDVERERPGGRMDARSWVRREACAKTFGLGLFTARRLAVPEDDGPVHHLLLPGPCQVAGVGALPAGYHAAVAAAGERPFRQLREQGEI